MTDIKIPERWNMSLFEGLPLLPEAMVSENVQVFLIGLYSATAGFALLANFLSFIIFKWGKKSRSELRTYLMNLSLADMMMSIFSIPFTYTEIMLKRWIFPGSWCPIVRSVQILSVFISVYTLTAIGVDRYFAIVHPLRSMGFLKSKRFAIVSIVWLLGLVPTTVQYFHIYAETFTPRGQVIIFCIEKWESWGGQLFTVILFVITFALPMGFIGFFYGSIAWKVFRPPGQPQTWGELPSMSSERSERSERSDRSASVGAATHAVATLAVTSNGERVSTRTTLTIPELEMVPLSSVTSSSGRGSSHHSTSSRPTSETGTNTTTSSRRRHLAVRINLIPLPTGGMRTRERRRKKAIKMLLLVVVFFLFCWLPIQIFNLVIWLRPEWLDVETESQLTWYIVLYMGSHWLAMAHSCVNPVIYCFMCTNMRIDLMDMARRALAFLCTCGKVRHQHRRPRPRSSFSPRQERRRTRATLVKAGSEGDAVVTV